MKRVRILIAIIAAFLMIVPAALAQVKPQPVPVPNVTGMPLSAAQQTLVSAGFNAVVTQENVTDPSKSNVVLKQQIAPGTTLAKGSNVPVIVGKYTAPAQQPVPNVVGMPLDKAQAALAQAKFNAVVTQENVADPGKNNVVLKQQIAAGAALAPGAQVPLIVGRYEDMVKVPNVVGMPKSQAISTLAAAGLQSGVLTAAVKEQNKHDVVMSQQMPAGSMMRKGSTVPISLGSYTAPVVLDAVVPNVVGMNYDQARAALEKAGFNWNNVQAFRKVVDDSKLSAGVIRAQDPAAGKKIPKTERVTLWGEIYQPRPKVAVPNVDKLTVEEAKQRIQAAGLYWGLSYKPTPTQSLNERVIEQAPAPGTLISKGESVQFTVGRFTAGELEIKLNHVAQMHTYLMQIRGGTPPYDVRIQYDIARPMAGQDAVKAIGLNDSTSYPGWKLYRITPKPGVDTKVSFIIKDATGKTKQYSAQIKYF